MTSIQDKMEDDDFNMPPLNCQATKTLQLGDLRLVRAAAASAYKSLVDEEQRLHRIFSHQAGTRGSIFLDKCGHESETPILN